MLELASHAWNPESDASFLLIAPLRRAQRIPQEAGVTFEEEGGKTRCTARLPALDGGRSMQRSLSRDEARERGP
jgi:hypothetical protein